MSSTFPPQMWRCERCSTPGCAVLHTGDACPYVQEELDSQAMQDRLLKLELEVSILGNQINPPIPEFWGGHLSKVLGDQLSAAGTQAPEVPTLGQQSAAPDHCCGAQGFGEPNDVCLGCEYEREQRGMKNPCSEVATDYTGEMHLPRAVFSPLDSEGVADAENLLLSIKRIVGTNSRLDNVRRLLEEELRCNFDPC